MKCLNPAKKKSTSTDHQSLIQTSDCIWYSHKEFDKDKQKYEDFKHVAIVLHTEDKPDGRRFFITWCVRNYYPTQKSVSVLKDSKNWKALHLDVTRYFYKGNFKCVISSRITPRKGHCPPELLSKLRQLVGLEED